MHDGTRVEKFHFSVCYSESNHDNQCIFFTHDISECVAYCHCIPDSLPFLSTENLQWAIVAWGEIVSKFASWFWPQSNVSWTPTLSCSYVLSPDQVNSVSLAPLPPAAPKYTQARGEVRCRVFLLTLACTCGCRVERRELNLDKICQMLVS